MMKRSLILAMCMMFAAGTGLAEKVGPEAGGVFLPQGDCPTDGYKPYTGSGGPIPDGDPAGVTFGPVPVPDDGTSFIDVVVDVEMSHTWVGDINVDLSYDLDCDGQPETTARLVCRPGQANCDPAGSTFGCNGDLGGLYRFSDDGAVELGVPCAAVLAPGCYAPNEALSVFDGLSKGGCFTLFANDSATPDPGVIPVWVVWTDNDGGGTPTETISWGSVKSRF